MMGAMEPGHWQAVVEVEVTDTDTGGGISVSLEMRTVEVKAEEVMCVEAA